MEIENTDYCLALRTDDEGLKTVMHFKSHRRTWRRPDLSNSSNVGHLIMDLNYRETIIKGKQPKSVSGSKVESITNQMIMNYPS